MSVNGKVNSNDFFLTCSKKVFLHVNILKRESRRKFYILHVFNLGDVVNINGGNELNVICCWEFLKRFKEMLIKTKEKIRNSK